MSAGSSAAAAAAAIAQATKASGVIIRLSPRDFANILSRQDEPLVVYARGGLFAAKYQYLTSYKGLAFFTKSNAPVTMPRNAELVEAQKIWIPG